MARASKLNMIVSVSVAALAAALPAAAAAGQVVGPPAGTPPDARPGTDVTPQAPQTPTATPQDQDVGPTDPAAPPAPGGLDDIIVTAQRRAESISKAPLAVSAVGQQTFDRLAATNIADVVKTVPSVSVTQNGVAIRGLGAVTTLGFGSPTVAFHIDGIYQEDFLPNVYDIERIEVLRGPQGTLYGRNSTAGVVNVITAKPVDRWTGTADLAAGSYGRMVGRAMLNVPVTSTLSVRGAVTYEYSQGSQFNPGDDFASTGVVTRGNRAGEAFDRLVARAAVRWAPTDRLTWNVNVTYEEDKGRFRVLAPSFYANFPNVVAPVTTRVPISPQLPPVTLIVAPGSQNFTGAIVYPSGFPREWAYQPPGSAALGSFAQRNASDLTTLAVRSNLAFEVTDQLTANYLFGYKDLRDRGRSQTIPYAQNDQYIDAKDYTHELDINYDGERVRGVLGLYYYLNRGPRDTFTRVWVPRLSTDATEPYTPPTVFPAVNTSFRDRFFRSSVKAVFGQVTVDLTDTLRLTGGARYNEDTVRVSEYSTSLCPFGIGTSPTNTDPAGVCATLAGLPNIAYAALTSTPITLGQLRGTEPFPANFNRFSPGRIVPEARIKFDKLSWKGTVEFDVSPETLTYATVATGYKQGGIGDQTLIGDARFYGPETDINYEIGVRTKLFDNRLSLNLTGFWTDYEDLQVPTIREVLGRPLSVVDNAARARTRGVEFEFGWALSDNDRISGYATYLDATIRDYENVGDVFRNITLPNVNGNRLALSPEFVIRGAYSHIFDLGSLGTLTPTLQGQYQTESFTNYINNIEQRVAPYFVGDISVRYEIPSGRMYVEGVANNVTDKNYALSEFPLTGGGVQYTRYALGRTFLGRLGFKF